MYMPQEWRDQRRREMKMKIEQKEFLFSEIFTHVKKARSQGHLRANNAISDYIGQNIVFCK